MKVAKIDANGNVVVDADGRPVLIDVPDAVIGGQNGGQDGVVARAEAERLQNEAVARARSEEKRKLNDDLERERAARKELEDRMKAAEDRAKEAALAALPIEQQNAARLRDLEQNLAQERGARLALEQSSALQIRQIGLVAYRERALRDVPAEVHDLVAGGSEEEIDQAVDGARNVYSRLESRLRAQLEQEHASRQPPVTQPPHAGPQGIPAPPPSPHYVPPPSPQAAAGANGFPTPTNPLPVTEGSAQPIEMSELTSEQAVRSGRYGGEMRESIHRAIRGNTRYPGALGSAPRHWASNPLAAPMAQQEVPGGAIQPQGHPTGPAAPPGAPQLQAPTSARAQAEAAIARTHAGGNPIANGDPTASVALTEGRSHLTKAGVASPAAAFAQRFTHTPPHAPGQG
jgi:hypothetical protein